ncbi:hypothetical protein H2200_009754 [Cladophialophora chaetospira]|uniref:Uncharacterized protein n=1 Tax=Cladophialophora chaetospira TaxID=386627 RepID=A0AA38X3A1_9EURO|nr:hypothetical protein H2200_009754 [Cladophialophora chaetospira]
MTDTPSDQVAPTKLDTPVPSHPSISTKTDTKAKAASLKPASTSSTVETSSQPPQFEKTGEEHANEVKISADVYHGVSTVIKDSLKDKFDIIASPIEYANTTEYKGPIKIYAACPKVAQTVEGFLEKLGEGMPFTVKTTESCSKIINLDVPWLSASRIIDANQASIGPTTLVTVQLQVFFTRNDYVAFRREKIDSELGKLLGKMIARPYGLTIKNGALYFRAEEIEKGHNKERYKHLAAIKISRKMKSILNFLGLDPATYEEVEKLATWDKLIQYAETCHFYNPNLLKESLTEVKVDKEGFIQSTSQLDSLDRTDNALKALTPNDLNRRASSQAKVTRKASENINDMSKTVDTQVNETSNTEKFKMTLFNFWSRIYLHSPTAKTEPGEYHCFTRAQVLEAAKVHFPDFAARFDQEKRTKSETKMWLDIHGSTIPNFVKDYTERKYALKGLKNFIRKGEDALTYKDLKYEVMPAFKEMKLSFHKGDFKKVLELARANWFYAQGAQKWFGTAKSARNYWKRKEKERMEEEAREREEKASKQQVLLDSYSTRSASGSLVLRKRASLGMPTATTTTPVR